MYAKIYVVPVKFNKKKFRIVRLENFFEYNPHKIYIELDDMRELGRKGVECFVIMDNKYNFK